jgi:hypothetical protein
VGGDSGKDQEGGGEEGGQEKEKKDKQDKRDKDDEGGKEEGGKEKEKKDKKDKKDKEKDKGKDKDKKIEGGPKEVKLKTALHLTMCLERTRSILEALKGGSLTATDPCDSPQDGTEDGIAKDVEVLSEDT